MHNVCWDYSWVEVDRRLCQFTFDYRHYFLLLPIILTVTRQLFLVSCNAKVIQLPYCNASCKGACGAPHKWFCWEVGSKYHCVYVVVIDLRCMLDLLWEYPVPDKSNPLNVLLDSTS